MTHNKDFKQLVRQRMEKTGERYTTARANLLGELARRSPPRARHDQTFCLRRLMGAHGITEVAGIAIDEAWLLGLGGGVSLQYNAFEYRGAPPLVYIGTRCNPQYAYDDRFIRRVLDGLGCSPNVLTATSANKAKGQLLEALGHGPVLCWVGREALHGNTAMAGATPWVVVVHDVDGDVFAVEDCFAGPMEVPADRLAAARVAVKKQKHRVLGMEGTPSGECQQAVWKGIEHCLDDLASGVVLGGSAKNYGLAALEKWAGLANQPRDAKGWPKLFGQGARLLGGLRQIWAWVHSSTDGGAFRPMYADFLARATSVTGVQDLEQAASAVAANGRRWVALTQDVFAGKHGVLRTAQRRLQAADNPTSPSILDDLNARADKELDAAFAEDFYRRLSSHLEGLVEGERAAQSALSSALTAGLKATG